MEKSITTLDNRQENISSKEIENNFDVAEFESIAKDINEQRDAQKQEQQNEAQNLISLLNAKDIFEQEKKEWKDDMNIIIDLISKWYWSCIENLDVDNNVKQALKNFQDNVYEKYWYKFKNNEEFKETFFNYLQDAASEWKNLNEITNDLYEKMENLEINEPITSEFIEHHIKEKQFNLNLSPKDRIHWNRENSESAFRFLAYYEDNFGDDCTFPESYNPKIVFEKWKSAWLWIDKVHEKYNWEWVDVAIIDTWLVEHQELKLEEYIKPDKWEDKPHFHWSAVASILTWKTTWIAPWAKLHYIETSSSIDHKNIIDDLNKLKWKGIRVISISAPIYQEWLLENEWAKEKLTQTVDELNDSWTRVLSSEEFYKNFWILDKKDPMWDIDDFDNYQISFPDRRTLDNIEKYKDYQPKNKTEEFIFGLRKQMKSLNELLFVNSWDRTVADPSSSTAFRHDSSSCTSWAIPTVAWYYTLACQADKSMTPEKFMNLARETATEVEAKDIYKDFNKQTEGRVPINTKIKVINIEALLKRIEETK